MRQPAFWYADRATTLATVMSPLAALYEWSGLARRAFVRPWQASCPVICIGNLVAGGAGKTPTAIAVAELVSHMGWKPAFLTRGYRGRLAGPIEVDATGHTAKDVGDEPLLLARVAPTWVARNRPAGARAAIAAGHDVIIMDDGFQNPSLHKDINIVVIDGEVGFGNGHVMPAGPLRESTRAGLKRAQAVLIVGEDRHNLARRFAAETEVLHARIVPSPAAQIFDGKRVVAFAGIGRPQKLFDSLEQSGCNVVEHYAFPDHHTYSPEQIMAICERAAAQRARPVTTEKDFVRLPAKARPMVDAFPISLEWSAPDQVRALLTDLLAKRRGTPSRH